MKRLLFIGITVSLLFASCDFFSKNQRNTERDYDIINEQDIEEYNDIDTYGETGGYLEDIPSIPEIVRPDIVNGKGRIDIYKYADQEVQVEIEPFGYKSVRATLTSEDPDANIRFSQIIMPDGQADGPFGRELSYQLPRDGIYKFIINENMMAGDPWAGYFTLEFELE